MRAGSRFWWPSSLPISTSVPSSAWVTSMRASAMVFFRIGERVALVTTPIWARPTWTQSPWPTGFLALHLQADQRPLRMLLPPQQRLAADEVLVLRVERHGEADAGLERIGLVAELVAGEDQAGLDAHHVERFEAERHQPVRLARLPDGVEHGERVLRMAEDLVAELAGIAGARDDDRRRRRSRRCGRW